MKKITDLTNKKSWRMHSSMVDVSPQQGTCHGMKMFVYDIPDLFLDAVFNDLSKHINLTCLLRDCALSWTSSSNLLAYSSEFFILARLLTQCARTKNPNKADFFLLPFPFSLWQVSGWVERRSRPNTLSEITPYVKYMNKQNARRHVFLDTNDSIFLIHLNLPYFKDSIVVHLGNELWSGQLIHSKNSVRRNVLFRNSIIVPYRTSADLTTVRDRARRSMLLFGALNGKRHPLRKKLLELFTKYNDTIMVAEMNTFSSLQEATYHMHNSKFCLAPSGDAPSFTQRFASAIISGCIPIHIDPYERQPQSIATDVHFPFFRQINWTNQALIIQPNKLQSIVKTIKQDNHAMDDSLRQQMKYDLMVKDASQSAIDEIHMLVKSLNQF